MPFELDFRFRWENFVDRDIQIAGRTLVRMKLLKENIVATRSKTSIIITGWKIFVTILFAYLFHHGLFQTSVFFANPTNQIEQFQDPLPKLASDTALDLEDLIPRERRQVDLDFDPTKLTLNEHEEQSHPRDQWTIYLTPMFVKIFSDALCFYMGRLACKLCMQRIGFALPITLITPFALTIFLLLCSFAPKSTVFVENFLYWSCYEEYAQDAFKWQVICGLILWWISELWIGRHIWFAQSQRLAFTDR